MQGAGLLISSLHGITSHAVIAITDVTWSSWTIALSASIAAMALKIFKLIWWYQRWTMFSQKINEEFNSELNSFLVVCTVPHINTFCIEIIKCSHISWFAEKISVSNQKINLFVNVKHWFYITPALKHNIVLLSLVSL